MNKILNRRHIFLEQIGWDRFSLLIEEVDNYLNHSKYFELASDEIIVYGNSNDIKLNFGREVIGNDPNISHHESIKQIDYEAKLVENIEISFESYEELESAVSLKLSKSNFENYRIKFKNLNLSLVTFF